MNDDDGLVAAYVLDGAGGGRPVGWGDIRGGAGAGHVLWLHLDMNAEPAQAWVRDESGLAPIVCDALLDENSRPRAVSDEQALFLVLRGVNLNPGADPEDMVALRVHAAADRVITLRRRRLMAVEDVRATLARGRGPRDAGDLVVHLAQRLTARVAPTLTDLDERMTVLEETIGDHDIPGGQQSLSALRHGVIDLRRHLAPQRDALTDSDDTPLPWMEARHDAALAEAANHVARYLEDLGSLRDRAAVLQDELRMRQAERSNRTMYLLTIVATVMLPLSFVTGLLGMNVGGIPATGTPWGFSGTVVVLVALGAVEVWVLRVLRWI